MSAIIQLDQVSKTFQQTKAVSQVDLSIEQGEVVAIIGPNGAGKTTLISLMLGLLRPSEGKVTIGIDEEGSLPLARIGVMLQQSAMVEDVKVRELIDLVRSFYPHPMQREEILQKVQLESVANHFAHKLSGGQKRRLSFALSIIGNPDLLFFDEPTVGMDVTSRKMFIKELLQLKQQGKTILFTTHYLEEVEEVADRIVMLAKGRKVSDGSLSSLRKQYVRESITFQLKEKEVDWSDIPHIQSSERKGDRWVLYTEDTDALLQELMKREIPMVDIQMEIGSLEDVFEEFLKGGDKEE